MYGKKECVNWPKSEGLKLRDADPDSGRGVTWPAIAFGLSAPAGEVREGQRLDVVYSLAADRRDNAPSTSAGGGPASGGGSGQGLELRVKDVVVTQAQDSQEPAEKKALE